MKTKKKNISKHLLLFLAIIIGVHALGQEPQRHSTYYHQKVSHFSSLPAPEGIVFLGNSITDGAEWQELFPDVEVLNRGISGDVSQGILDRLPNIIEAKPRKLFLMIGINDLAAGVEKNALTNNIQSIIDNVQHYSPYTEIYVQSMLPVNNNFRKFKNHIGQQQTVQKVNTALKQAATKEGYTFIDLYSEFLNEDGKLDASYTNDGLHLTGEAYLLWKHLIYPYIYDLEHKPSLIPAPLQLQWNDGRYSLQKTKHISISEQSLKSFAEELVSRFPVNKPEILIEETTEPSAHSIRIQLEKDEYDKEAYNLEVTSEGILLNAGSPQGAFYGLQTLFQLMRDQVFLPSCTIHDKPAFAWRGLMHDVGRNYIPVKELKEHIDILAKYKMNVFHMHLTEDIAWRLAIEGFPELTAASNMQRNPGMYYTMEELKELIEYCEKRYITLVPEIDMPGHSESFERAFDAKMQSEKGKNILKQIVHYVASELDVPYFHFGGDEVEISDPTFLPEMSKIIRSYGKEVIGWWPGGNLDDQTTRQLWASVSVPEEEVPLIDSRHLYLNHNDPLGGIVKTFNRQVLDVPEGNDRLLGGEICIWPDRRPVDIEQTMLMNAVYPSILTFAERIWKGGGFPEHGVLLGKKGSAQLQAFLEFEDRLLDHKIQYFPEKHFPYVQQRMAKWQISKPYNNEGDLNAVFEPQTQPDFWKEGETQEVYGSTIWLRHFFGRFMKGNSGYIQEPEENSTSYAYTEVYAPANKEVNMWISFHNPSRSETDDTAPVGEWDYKKSKIWLNGKEIAPPDWSKPGRQGEREAPYVDESFEIRVPHTVPMKKGWNKILLKLPVGKFTTDEIRLVKWMFTVAFIEEVDGQWQNARGIRYK